MSKVRKTDFQERNWASSPRFGLDIHRLERELSVAYTGTYTHPLGIVSIWAIRYRETDLQCTTLEIVVDGQIVRRRWLRCWSLRTIPSLARQLLQDYAQ